MVPTPLQIKTNALKRLIKDKQLYQEEIKTHESSIDSLESTLKAASSGADNEEQQYNLKNLIKIKEETIRLLPGLNSKIEEILNDLKEYLNINPGDSTDEIRTLISSAEAEIAN